jgi:putative NADPH-quinone reductase
MKKVLVVAAHRYPDQSRISRATIDAFAGLPDVTVHELTREYPDFQIDVQREQALLSSHESVVMLFPFWWYSTPSILKEWQDQVLTYGFAYGSQGKALHGKKLLVMTSTGGSEQAYTPEGYNRYAIDALLLPLQATSNMTGMIWQKPALIQGANDITDALIDEGVTYWLSRIQELKGS